MLELDNISKEYPTPREPIDSAVGGHVLSLKRGGAVAIMGPSGAGKSTLLYIAGGLETPSSGSVMLDGRSPYQLSEKELAAFRNQAVGFVFQDHCLLPQCSLSWKTFLVPTLVAGNHEDLSETRPCTAGAGWAWGSPGSSPVGAFGRRETAGWQSPAR